MGRQGLGHTRHYGWDLRGRLACTRTVGLVWGRKVLQDAMESSLVQLVQKAGMKAWQERKAGTKAWMGQEAGRKAAEVRQVDTKISLVQMGCTKV